MTVLVWLLVIGALAALVARQVQVRKLGDEPPFRTEDDPTWVRRRWLGSVD